MVRSKNLTHKIMSSIKSENTNPERILGKVLWQKGIRYRKHYKIPGKPDYAILKHKIAIFCDGDFWHGNNWKIRNLGSLEKELENYTEFWKNKILKNIARDKKVNKTLKSMGWKIFRFWESDIKKNSNKCVDKIVKFLSKRIQNLTEPAITVPMHHQNKHTNYIRNRTPL
ncbi:MAG: very short patch repair endonuclease [Bacteroidales bacterium]|nr:very short patch repair endonuclease [Bacteroidales bacterium]